MARPMPDGYHSATPSLTVLDAAAAIDFYRRAFGAQELLEDPSGHHWTRATHVEDAPPDEMGRRHQQFLASLGQPRG